MFIRARPHGLAALLASVVAMFAAIAQPASQGASYTVYTTDGQRTLPYRTSGNIDFVPLQQVASLFGLTLAEDSLVGGLTVRGRGQTILLIPNQSFASIGPGRIVSLPAPVERDGNTWRVPIEFLRVAVGPALGTRIEIRRGSRAVLVGDVRLPRVTPHFERQGTGGRLIIDVQPSTPHQVTRVGNRLVVRFDAVAIETTPVTDLAPELVTGVRTEGAALMIDLGPSSATFRAEDRSPTQLHIELGPPPPPPPPLPPAPEPARPAVPESPRPGVPEPARPVMEMNTPGVLRTIVIDPGHGGDDSGVVGRGGTLEKDYVLTFARRLKARIEERIGLRVLLTRDRDEDVPLDRRAALANNNKADLFISLHANASVRPDVKGAQVLSLRLDDYAPRAPSLGPPDLPVPMLNGASRVIEVLPWDMAQIGFTEKSDAVAAILRRHLTAAGVPLAQDASPRLPLRPLVGANMPAVLVELGFLSSAEDERALNGSDRSSKFLDAILNTIAEIRQGIPMSTTEAR